MAKNDLIVLNTEIKKCKICTELVKTRNQIVPGYGDFKAKILIIGEAPGRFGADITGIPFTKDRSGVFLQKILRNAGLSDSEPESIKPKLKGVYITNIVKCNPRGKNDTNRTPDDYEIENCNGFLQKEIEIINPKIIITLGVSASKIILKEKFTGSKFGKVFKIDGFLVLPLWHPAFVIRGGGSQRMNEKKYFKYFQKIKKIVN